MKINEINSIRIGIHRIKDRFLKLRMDFYFKFLGLKYNSAFIIAILYLGSILPIHSNPNSAISLQEKSKNSSDNCSTNDLWNPPQSILESLRNVDVLILGEEHDDKDGHNKKLSILNHLSQEYSLSLSLEMLEWHQENSLQEYLTDTITVQSFLNDSNLWKNFISDYLPLIKCAKSRHLPVIPANPPRKYVNLISRKGILGFRDISIQNWNQLPQPQNILRDRSANYEKRLKEVFSSIHGESNTTSKKETELERMILAQHTWDAGMTERIVREHYRSGNKILHINGRFHSDFEGGLVYRLKKAGLRVATVTLLPDTEKNRELERVTPKIADFLIFTNPPID